MKALAWAYDLAVEGSGRLHSAEQLATPFTARPGTQIQQSNALIRWQIAKASAFDGVTTNVVGNVARKHFVEAG